MGRALWIVIIVVKLPVSSVVADIATVEIICLISAKRLNLGSQQNFVESSGCLQLFDVFSRSFDIRDLNQ